VVLRDKPWPALVRTGGQMAQYGATLALVGGTFATVDVSGGPALPGMCACCLPAAARHVSIPMLHACFPAHLCAGQRCC
jgi:hypothetical protein